MPTAAEVENHSDDYHWGMAVGEAQKSGYIGTEAAMKLLKI